MFQICYYKIQIMVTFNFLLTKENELALVCKELSCYLKTVNRCLGRFRELYILKSQGSVTLCCQSNSFTTSVLIYAVVLWSVV